jgi:transcriptional regulator with XRE-family HTH domain
VTYGARLRELRAERQLSLREVEEQGGPNKDTMSLIERGVHKPQPQTLGRIAKALGVSVAELRSDLEAAEHPLASAPPSQEKLFNNGGLEDAAQPEALQKALAVLFQGLARRGQGIVEQSLREGPSEALSRELNEYYAEVAALHRLKGRRDIFGRDSGDLTEAEAAYQEVANRIEAMLRQDVDATEKERNVARRFKDNSKSYEMEEPKADAS